MTLSDKLLNAYPFLKELPASRFNSIDHKEISLPTPNEQAALLKLSSILPKNIFLYKRGYSATKLCLCKLLESARLTDKQVLILKKCEAKLNHKRIIVAYENPIVIGSMPK